MLFFSSYQGKDAPTVLPFTWEQDASTAHISFWRRNNFIY